MFKTTRALVLREAKYKEADKILTVLTDDEGKLTVSARGVMRGGSKNAAACQLLTFSDMSLFESKGRWYVRESQSIEQFLGLREDIASLALGTYFAELLEAVSDEDSPNPEVLRLGLNALFALSRNLHEPEHIKAVFELRLMCISGYEPSLDYCPTCQSDEIAEPYFSTLGGTVICKACRGGGHGECLPLCSSSLAALKYIVGADSKKCFSFALEPAAAKKLYKVCEAFVAVQLERRFSALDYWRAIR